MSTKAIQRARLRGLPIDAEKTYPIQANLVGVYMHNRGMVIDLQAYCSVDAFLLSPVVAQLDKHLPVLFKYAEVGGDMARLKSFARKVASYDYGSEHARDVFVVLSVLINFVEVASQAEEVMADRMPYYRSRKAFVCYEDFDEMTLLV